MSDEQRERERAYQSRYYREVTVPKRRAAGIRPQREAKHGTRSGVARHVRLGEPLCALCLAFRAAIEARKLARQNPRCGTIAGLKLHARRGEICVVCRKVEAERLREYRKRRRTKT